MRQRRLPPRSINQGPPGYLAQIAKTEEQVLRNTVKLLTLKVALWGIFSVAL